MARHWRVMEEALIGALTERLAPDMRFAVACSGGADSLAMAHLAHRLFAGRAVLLHVDHGLGAGSAQVAEWVARWARECGMEAHVSAVEVQLGGSLEAAARRARYHALGQLCRNHGLRWLLTAHTQRDVVETVLMRMLRGADLRGARGIRPAGRRILRPWLAVRHELVEQYCRVHGLTPWDDPMNQDRRFLRVRVRHELLPALRRENPQVDAALAHQAELAQSWYEATRALRFQWWRRCAREVDTAGEWLAVEELVRAPKALGYWVLRRWLRRKGATAVRQQLDTMWGVCHKPGASQVELADVRIAKEYQRLFAMGEHNSLGPDLPELPPPYQWRRWQPGDRMRPVARGGRSRKLSDLFAEARIPRSERTQTWVVVDTLGGEVVWAEGLGGAAALPAELQAAIAAFAGGYENKFHDDPLKG